VLVSLAAAAAAAVRSAGRLTSLLRLPEEPFPAAAAAAVRFACEPDAKPARLASPDSWLAMLLALVSTLLLRERPPDAAPLRLLRDLLRGGFGGFTLAGRPCAEITADVTVSYGQDRFAIFQLHGHFGKALRGQSG
jgi:hypothetical protein